MDRGKNLAFVLFVISATLILGSTTNSYAVQPSGDFEACLNGEGDGICNTPDEWGAQNISTKIIYTEGESIPVRVDLINIPDDESDQVLTVDWDVTKQDNDLSHTYDYITSYDRNDTPNPCFDIGFASGCVLDNTEAHSSSIPIPAPGTNPGDANANTSDQNIIAGGVNQPIDSFDAITDPNEKLFWMFVPTGETVVIKSIKYDSQGDPTVDSTTQLSVTFTTTSSHVVAAFGVHVASLEDWKLTASTTISGKPYQVGCVDITGGTCNGHINLSSVGISPFIPKLTLVKIVDNQEQEGSAPSDFELFATGETSFSGPGPTQSSGADFAAGPYALTETGPEGYTDEGYSCVITGTQTGVTVTDGSVTVGAEDDITCTITNTLTVIADTGDGGDNAWDTRPTFGVNHETRQEIIVENGFRFNEESFTINDNHWTALDEQIIQIGAVNSFGATVYASQGLKVQEFLFGVPEVGMGHLAEMRIEVWFDNTGEIDEIKVLQKSEVIESTSLVITHEKVKCLEADIEENCDSTLMSAVFFETLADKTMAIKAMDWKLRDQTTYLNDGFYISGDSLNPMNTMMIPSTVKYEGLIKITQNEKYSDYWTTDDGRIFEINSSGSFKQINQEFKRFQDSGEPLTRLHSGFASLIEFEKERALKVFDASELSRDCNFIQCY